MPDLGVRMITAVDCTIVRTSEEYDSKYLVQYLSTPMYFRVVNSFLGGGTRQRISRGNISGIDIPIPSTIEEQQKIGECFANLDNLITLHHRKLIFFKKNLINDWDQRKVSDITTSYSGGTSQGGNAEYYNGDIPFIRAGEI